MKHCFGVPQIQHETSVCVCVCVYVCVCVCVCVDYRLQHRCEQLYTCTYISEGVGWWGGGEAGASKAKIC